jgi:two-component system, NtrC family, sensor kinase
MFNVYGLFLFLAIWQLFSRKINVYFWLLIFYSVLSIPIVLNFYEWGWVWGFIVHVLTCMCASLLITFKAWRKLYRDLGILITGISLYLISFSIFILIYLGLLPNGMIFHNFYWTDLLYHFSVICVPVSLSIYLSREFAFTSKELENKLSEVEKLSAEKQQMLISQNETLEQQVAARTTELKQSLADLRSTQSQLIQSEKMASLGELTAGIAHEIQNPLNFVNNFSEVNKELIEELSAERLKPTAERNEKQENEILNDIKANEEKINHHGKRADAIVKGMLQHSSSGSGKKEPTDINALADEYLRLSYHGLRAKDKSFNATLKTDFDESIGNINIIPQDIGRVVLNLINNAFYAVDEKKKQIGDGYEPTVSLSTKKVNGRVEIKVADNGNGIPQKVLDKIFQPFFTTKPTGQGTGLGLSLSYDIVKAHGGEIKVETKEREGTVFILQLPTTK